MPNLLAEYAPRDACPCLPVPEHAPAVTIEDEWYISGVQPTDYAPAVALGYHLLPCVLVTKEGPAKIDTEDAVKVLCCS